MLNLVGSTTISAHGRAHFQSLSLSKIGGRAILVLMGDWKPTTNARFSQFLQPVLDAIKALGGSARPSEVKECILKTVKLPQDYVNAVHQGGESKFGNDVDWARFYLVRAGYLDSSRRGVWSLTELGGSDKIDSMRAAQIIKSVDGRNCSIESPQVSSIPATTADSYVYEALKRIKSLPAADLRIYVNGCYGKVASRKST